MRNSIKNNTIKTIGIDLAKSIFHLHGVDGQGKVVIRKRLSRSKLAEFMAQLPPCLVAMEACGGSHHWARKFQAMGHDVRLISPQFVKPYVKSNKNDTADAEAICEAVQRPNMRFVPIKSIEQFIYLRMIDNCFCSLATNPIHERMDPLKHLQTGSS